MELEGCYKNRFVSGDDALTGDGEANHICPEGRSQVREVRFQCRQEGIGRIKDCDCLVIGEDAGGRLSRVNTG